MFCRLFLGRVSVCGIACWCGEEEAHLAARGKLVDPRTDKRVERGLASTRRNRRAALNRPRPFSRMTQFCRTRSGSLLET